MPTITNQNELKNAFGKSYRFVQRDADGLPLRDPETNVVVIAEGDTCDLIQSILQQIPAWAMWQGDSKAIARVMRAVNESRQTGDSISLAEGDYEWLCGAADGSTVGIIDRKMPPATRQAHGIDEENPASFPTVGMTVWDKNEGQLRGYLKAE